jgi:hypothetical protein
MPNNKGDKEYHSPWTDLSLSVSSKAQKREPFPVEPKSGWGIVAIVGVVLVLVIGAVYVLFFRNPGGPNVGLEFARPNQILIGDPFVLSATFSNYSDSILKNVKVSLQLPDGVSFLGQPQGQRVLEQAVGDLGPGSLNQQNFNLIITSGGESLKKITAKLTYSTGVNSSAQFENSAETDILVSQPSVSLVLGAPQSILNGQDFELKVDYANNTSHEFKNIHLKVDYPPVFQFKNSTVHPENPGNNSWNLGTLPSGSGDTISIRGSVIGPERSFLTFNGSLSADFLGGTYTLNSQTVNIGISPAPLSVGVTVVGGQDDIFRLGDTANYTLTYTNNSDVVMQNITISSKLIGELFDFTSLRTDASFNSLSNAITWYAANTPQLMNLAPGQSGSVSFSVKLSNSYPIRLLSDKNYTLRLQVQIESPTVPPNTVAAKTISLASAENKVAGMLDIAAEAYWRDAASGILNNGPYPPRVNQPTQYTIHWKLTNYAADVTNITVSSYLQSGSRFTGNVKSNIDSMPTYDPNSGLVSWQISSLPATKGVIGPPAEAIFQIENTPAITQINRSVQLLGETKIEWTDSFVGMVYTNSASALDTTLPYDTTITTTDRDVQQ